MNSVSASHYVVYSISRYFSRQPEDMRHCPVCGSRISVTTIQPSKAVVKDLEHLSLIPAHNFSRLYQCSECRWWAVRESWAYYECNSSMDYLIVSTDNNAEGTGHYSAPWEQALQNENIYRSVKSLPDELGKLFVGGKKAVQWSTTGHIFVDTVVHKTLLANECPSLATQGSQVSIVSFETYKANFMERQLRDRYWSRKPLDQQLIEDMLYRVQQKIRQGELFAARLEIVEPASIKTSEDSVLCKRGEIYLIEVSSIDRRIS